MGAMSGARIATGLAVDDAGVDAFAEAAGRAALGLGGAPSDLAVVFGGAPNLDHLEDGLRVVRDRIGADAVVGCGAQGVVGSGPQLEQGGVDVRPCVSQGARPIGPEMVVTAGEGNVIEELASKPALVRLKEAIAELDFAERTLAAQGLLLGIVIDENRPEYGRGDFLIRGLLGVDEESGSISVGEQVRVGQTVRLQVRDGA